MTFKHDFRIIFSVSGSNDPSGMDLSGAAMLAALKERIVEFEANPQLLRDMAGAPLTSSEQPSWVLRQIGRPGVIRQSDGGWIQANAASLRTEDALTSEKAANIPAGRDGFWCRADDFEGDEVLADLHSDDRVIETKVDIRPWLETASIGDIEELQADGWSYAESADRLAYHLEGLGDPGAVRLFHYLGLRPRMSFTGDDVGFGLSVDEGDVLRWLEENRPDAYRAIAGEEEPAP